MHAGENEDSGRGDAPTVYHGRCLCGGIRVQVRGPLAPLVYCHCAQCRRTAGAPFLAVLPVASAAFALDDPHGLLAEFRATPDKARCFCARCGAPVLSRRDGGDGVRVRAGLFDDLGGIMHGGHIFVAAAACWDTITDRLPQYAALEPARATPSR
ncbi:MAG: GFA family protein [Gammaproteobacteria bacterium]